MPTTPAQKEAMKRYQQKNKAKFAETQRLYRIRVKEEKERMKKELEELKAKLSNQE